MRRILSSGVTLFIMTGAGPALWAAEPLILNEEVQEYSPAHCAQILADPQGNLTFDQVRIADPVWRDNRQDVINFAFSDSAYWIRTRIQNPGEKQRDMILELSFPLHDYVDVYVALENNKFHHFATGDRRPFASRPIDHAHFLFPVSVPPDGRRDVYIRLQSHDGLHEAAPLILRDRSAFIKADSWSNYYNGAIFGILLIMLKISSNTVNHHAKNIYRKLNVHNRSELSRKAASAGLLDDSDPQ